MTVPDDRHVRAAAYGDLYDGDSLTLILDVWRDLAFTLKSRLLGVDTPELAGPTVLEKAAAYEAKQYVDRWLVDAGISEWPLRVRSVKITRARAETGDVGKYGRLLVRVWRVTDGRELAADLLENGLARIYFGGERMAWTPAELERMLTWDSR